MSKPTPIQIGPIRFPTKKAAKDHVRGIIGRYKNGETIVGKDDAFLRDLILLHTEVEEKVGCGVSHFTVDLDREFRKTRHIVVVRLDGSFTDASCVKNCIDGKDHKSDVMAALRYAVASEIITFKRTAFKISPSPRCPYLHQVLTVENCHIDHIPPDTFKALAEKWMAPNSLSVEGIQLVATEDNQYVCALRDTELVASWQKFHTLHAKLRVISTLANLSMAKKNLTPSTTS